MEKEKRRTWAEVSLKQLELNYRALRELIPQGCRFMGVVKSNAYGHGAVVIAETLQALGADYLGVACLEEGIELREGGVALPILILGATCAQDAPKLAGYGLAQTVSTLEEGRTLSGVALEAGKKITIHVKADTGMSRLGFLAEETHVEQSCEEILELCRLPGLHAEGIYTHFADSDGDEDYTVLQFGRFLTLLDKLAAQGRVFEIRHSANSGATLRYPFSHLDMVRPGLALYGYYPGEDMQALCPLAPVMELKSRLVSLKQMPEGTRVSYGCTGLLENGGRLAVVPIGYGDGFFRGFSNCFTVQVHGKCAPIVGRVCMDMCMIDLTDIPEARLWDEVVIYSRDLDSGQTMERGAKLLDTISYELLCAIAKRVPRLYSESLAAHHTTRIDID